GGLRARLRARAPGDLAVQRRSAPAVLTTRRLRGERIGPEHEAALAVLLGDPRVGRTLGGVRSASKTAEIVALHAGHWVEHGFGYWFFSDRATREPVGRGGLSRTHIAGRDEVEVGWAVLPERWGLGYATELGAAAVDVAFTALGL